MSFRRGKINRSKKVPGVKLRPAAPGARRDHSPESAWAGAPDTLVSDEESPPPGTCPRPFKGFVLCATGINDKTTLFKLALELGAQSTNDLTDRVTHLVAQEPGSAKYRCALENRIPIMHPSWIEDSYKVWLRGDDVEVQKSIEEHRLKPFSSVVLCVSGIDDGIRRQHISREVNKAGGSYAKVLERPVKVTHLLCGNTSEANSEKVRYAHKFNASGEAAIHIVWEDWFWDSLKFGGLFDEDRYKVTNPPPPPRPLPQESAPPAASSIPDGSISMEAQPMEDPVRPAASGAANEEEEEIASVKRVPAVTLHLWENILKHRGFEVQGGRLVRSPSKSQSASQHQFCDVSPSRAPAKPSRRGTLKDLDDDSDGDRPRSAISAFRRARSFMPPVKDTSTPLGGVRQPFQRSSTMSRASSFLQRSVGSIHAQGGISTDIPIASTSALAGPSRAGSLAPEDDFAKATSAVSEAARTIFKGLHFRALGEARCASVKRAIEDCGGTWAGPDDDADADIVIVRLVSGSTLYQQEPDAHERAKFRTECWLERCLFAERVCDPAEHVAFTPLTAQPPVDGADSVQLSFSGLDHAEACWIKRLLRALGIALAPNFSRRSTHLLCPSGVGAKADKAREWGTPVVTMDWLATIARTGAIPPSTLPEHAPAEEQEDGLDIQAVVPQPRADNEWMASQPPPASPPRPDPKGKGKEKAAEVTMVDITNAEAAAGWSRSLSYRDPSPDDLRPGQAEQMEVEEFGKPALLLGDDPHSSGSPANVPLTATQPASASEPEGDAVSIPSRVFDDRVPSSESPSPLRMPGAATPRSPSTPSGREKLARTSTRHIQDRITSLLGKRPSGGDDDEEEGGPTKLKRHDSRVGLRPKPLQRTRSTMSSSEHSPALLSPAAAFAAAASPVPTPELDLIPPAPGSARAKSKPHPTSADEAETSMSADERPSTLDPHLAYADPDQDGELNKLKYLLNRTPGEGGGAEWDLDLQLEKELTLPQLPDVLEGSAASSSAAVGKGKRPVARGRRGRGRKRT